MLVVYYNNSRKPILLLL